MKKQPHGLTNFFPNILVWIRGLSNSAEFCFTIFLQNYLKLGANLDDWEDTG